MNDNEEKTYTYFTEVKLDRVISDADVEKKIRELEQIYNKNK